jgi:hypothetical protein
MAAKHVQEMMKEAPHNSPTGQQICTSIEQAKLELGLEGRLFDHNFKTVGHLLTEGWIKKVCPCKQNAKETECLWRRSCKMDTRGRNFVNSTCL